MDFQKILKGFLQSHEIPSKTPLQFHGGQVFYGKVQKLYPNQHAEIRLGIHKLIAKLEVPLSVGEGYWLQVSSGEGNIKLRLLQPSSTNTFIQKEIPQIVKQFGLPNEKVNRILVRFLMNEQIPLSLDEIQEVSKLLRQTQSIQSALEVIKQMSKQSLPFNETIFQSLMAMTSSESTFDLMNAFRESLQSSGNQSQFGKDLIDLLRLFHGNDQEKLNSQDLEENPLTNMKEAVKKTGIFYEGSMLNEKVVKKSDYESVKPLLIKYLQEADPSEQSRSIQLAEKLLNRMNGMQLLSTLDGPIQQVYYEIPISYLGQTSELKMQWTGKKTKEGKINPDFCRIIFYLELGFLKETFVDMQVQNRIVSITVINHSNELSKLAKDLIPSLKMKLQAMDYHLSSIHFKQPEDDSNKDEKQVSYKPYHSSYNGVDIRV